MAKLFTVAQSYQAFKALVVAQYTGFKLDVQELKEEELAAKCPLGKAPVLETKDLVLSEPNAIARYLAKARPEANLLGGSFAEQALVEQWLEFAAAEIEAPGNVWTFPILGLMKADKRGAELAKQQIKKSLEILNDFLSLRTFLVGQRLSLADIVVATSLLNLYKLVLDPVFRADFGNVTRWFTTIVNQPEFKAVVGEVALCNQAPKEEAKKEQKPKEQKPKEEPKAKKEKKEVDEDEEAAAPRKPANADEEWALRPSKMDLDASKKLLVNNKPEAALPEFFANFDAEHYKLFFAKYKYAEENDSWVRTRNLLGGYLQRLPTLRRQAFGCATMTGHLENPDADGPGPFCIVIAWCSKTPGVPLALTDCDDTASYDVVEVNPADAEQRARWESVWAGEQIDGVAVVHREKYV